MRPTSFGTLDRQRGVALSKESKSVVAGLAAELLACRTAPTIACSVEARNVGFNTQLGIPRLSAGDERGTCRGLHDLHGASKYDYYNHQGY